MGELWRESGLHLLEKCAPTLIVVFMNVMHETAQRELHIARIHDSPAIYVYM